jgi:hypothetical protein
MQIINNSDLNNNKYTTLSLKNNIYNLDLLKILRTQILDEEFCVNYILNKDFQITREEQDIINIDYVLYFQPHLQENKLIDIAKFNAINKNNKDLFNFEEYI